MNNRSIKEEVYEFIGKDQIVNALELMTTEARISKKELTLLKARHENYVLTRRHNLKEESYLKVEIAQIRKSIMDLADGIDGAITSDKLSPFVKILAHQIDFIKVTIKKMGGTRFFILGGALLTLGVFGLIYWLFNEELCTYSYTFFIALIFVFIVINVTISLLLKNHIESFRHNQSTLQLHQTITSTQKDSL